MSATRDAYVDAVACMAIALALFIGTYAAAYVP